MKTLKDIWVEFDNKTIVNDPVLAIPGSLWYIQFTARCAQLVCPHAMTQDPDYLKKAEAALKGTGADFKFIREPQRYGDPADCVTQDILFFSPIPSTIIQTGKRTVRIQEGVPTYVRGNPFLRCAAGYVRISAIGNKLVKLFAFSADSMKSLEMRYSPHTPQKVNRFTHDEIDQKMSSIASLLKAEVSRSESGAPRIIVDKGGMQYCVVFFGTSGQWGVYYPYMRSGIRAVQTKVQFEEEKKLLAFFGC